MGYREASLNTDQKDTDALVSDIRETRRSIDSTLEQLSEAIKPARLLGSKVGGQRVMNAVHRSTRELGDVAESTRHQISNSVKSRPIAASIMAAGVLAAVVNVDAKMKKRSSGDSPAMAAESKLTRSYQSNPLAYGAAALGLGTLIGLAYPHAKTAPVHHYDTATGD